MKGPKIQCFDQIGHFKGNSKFLKLSPPFYNSRQDYNGKFLNLNYNCQRTASHMGRDPHENKKSHIKNDHPNDNCRTGYIKDSIYCPAFPPQKRGLATT